MRKLVSADRRLRSGAFRQQCGVMDRPVSCDSCSRGVTLPQSGRLSSLRQGGRVSLERRYVQPHPPGFAVRLVQAVK